MNTLPEDFKKLLENANSEPTPENLRGVRSQLHDISHQATQTQDNTDLRVELVKIWLENDFQCMQAENEYRVNLFTVDAVCALLSDKAVIEHILENYNYIKMLAFYSLEIVGRKIASKISRRNKEVIDVLSACIGKPVTNDASLTLESATNMLYGQMAYSIYRPDVEYDDELPSYLLSQDILVAGAVHLKEKLDIAKAAIDMPDCLS